MFVDSTAFSGICSCGREHRMVTRAAVIEPGALFNFEKYMNQFGISGRRCTLYGENSYGATADRHPKAEQEIILNPDSLHADEKSTALVLEKLEKDIEIIIAVGSGTIHDIARFCAHDRGIRFVSCPTAASVDGFCSTVAAMTWYGYKKTLPAVAPEIVIADTEIIRKAPRALVLSGIGDIMAKYTARADWEIAHLLTGEYLCERIRDIMAEAADTVMDSIPGILEGKDEAYTNVTYALVMSGIAMQMMGNSRPASGAEHHLSHMIEMGPEKFTVRFPALHGEKTGVGSVVASEEYERLAQIEDISPYLTDYAPVNDQEIKEFFGERLAGAIVEENQDDCLRAVTKERLAECWPEIREIIRSIPGSKVFYDSLTRLNAKKSLEDIGVSSDDRDTLLKYSPLVRNRLTLMRIRRIINLKSLYTI